MSLFPRSAVGGPLLGPSPDRLEHGLCLDVRLCDLRPALISKGGVGRHYRAVARNGRVLVASPLPPADLAGRVVRLRLSYWHRRILPGEAPEPFGLLLVVRPLEGGGANVYPSTLA